MTDDDSDFSSLVGMIELSELLISLGAESDIYLLCLELSCFDYPIEPYTLSLESSLLR